MTRKVICNNWDSNEPEKLRDAQTGELIGVLMPRTDEATLKASPGIQAWSRPGGVPDVIQDNPDGVATFAEHWERVHRETYPLANIKPETKLEADARKARTLNFSGD